MSHIRDRGACLCSCIWISRCRRLFFLTDTDIGRPRDVGLSTKAAAKHVARDIGTLNILCLIGRSPLFVRWRLTVAVINWLRGKSHRRLCTYINIGVAHDIGTIATTIDIPDSTQGIRHRWFIRGLTCPGALSSHVTLYLIDIDMSIACNHCRRAIATTIDIIDTGERAQIQRRTRLSFWRCVISQITTTIEISYSYRTTSRLFDVHCDRAHDIAILVVAAKHVLKSTVGDGQHHVVVYLGSPCATVDGANARDTS